jgi:hypothetical protein
MSAHVVTEHHKEGVMNVMIGIDPTWRRTQLWRSTGLRASSQT